MSTRFIFGVVASAVLTSAAALAQTNDQTSREVEAKDTPITVVGCVQRESDYRRQNDTGQGGVVGTGIGIGNEYVLVDSAGDCATLAPGAAAYELTGKGEPELKAFVGRRVEVTGIMKSAGLTVDGRAEGGIDPIGRDLKLREVNMTSFREAGAVRAQAADRRPDAERLPVGTSGGQAPQQAPQQVPADTLPRTASPLALIGLLGLLSAGGAIGIRVFRPRLM